MQVAGPLTGRMASVKGLRVLLFDVFGTLVDWRSSLTEIGEAVAASEGTQADWAAIVDDWRRAYQPALDRVRSGAAWRDLDSLQRETLTDVLTRHGVALGPACRETLVRGWRRLRPWPDSREGLGLAAPRARHRDAVQRARRPARRPAQVRRPAG